MLFNSFEFIFFLPVVLVFYYLLPQKGRLGFLLLASYFFYGNWNPIYLFLIIGSTLVDYWCGYQMGKSQTKRIRYPFLVISILSNLGMLFFFKYYNFFIENLNLVTDKSFSLVKGLILPVGISFYTFQTLSYSIDVFNGKIKAEKHLGYFALYVSFFPQLVAGPIERYSRLAPQLKQKKTLSYSNLSNGFRLILFGFFVKMVVADNLSGLVDKVYESPNLFSSLDLLKTTFFYSFQIYCDFFGYSLIAIGSARLLGIKLMDNFKTPYLSKSIAEFWKRWHISLSTWFRDYLYFQLGGNKAGKIKWILNILVVFIISGIWHGANWTFLIWGGFFAIFYLLEKGIGYLFRPKDSFIKNAFYILKTFIITSFFWVFFRSQSVQEAIDIISRIFSFLPSGEKELHVRPFVWIVLISFILSELWLYNSRINDKLNSKPILIRWSIYFLLIFSILAFSGTEPIQFIYFQF